MTSSDDNKQRNREIAQNEAERQTTGDIRVSAWTIAFTIILAVSSPSHRLGLAQTLIAKSAPSHA